MRHGQLPCVFTGFLKILPPFLFIIPGILCYALHPNLKDADDAFVTMLRNYMPAGLTGMMVAVFLAMLISTIDSAINAFSTLFTIDIYKRHIRPGAGPEQVAKVGRFMTIVTALIALGMAFTWKTFDEELWRIGGVLMSAVAPTVATVFLFGVLWKRATKASALITMCSGAAVCWSAGLLNLWGIPYEGFWPPYMVMTIYGFLFSSAVMTVSTLCTRNASDEQPLDSLRESYRKYGGLTRAIWALWAILAALMAAIYIVFD
jgi:SSS family solute:Na+ symporter